MPGFARVGLGKTENVMKCTVCEKAGKGKLSGATMAGDAAVGNQDPRRFGNPSGRSAVPAAAEGERSQAGCSDVSQHT